MQRALLLLICLSIAAFAEPTTTFIKKNAVQVSQPGDLPEAVLHSIEKYRIISIGEIHGTNEGPELVLGVLRLFEKTGKSVLLGLEIPSSEQPHIEAFLKTGDLAPLKASPFFQRDYQDGRSSKAMAKLLSGVRTLSNTRVFGFDATNVSSGQDRDEKMAINLQTEYLSAPTDYVVYLAGNIHAAISIGTPFDPKYRPMGYQLIHQPGSIFSENDFFSLKIRNEEGETWCCLGASVLECKIHAMNFGPSNYSKAFLSNLYFLKESDLFEGYKATFFIRKITPSTPLKDLL